MAETPVVPSGGPPQIDSRVAAGFMDVLQKAAKRGSAPDTSSAPPNISASDMEKEIASKTKTMQDALTRFMSMSLNEGFRSKLEKIGNCYILRMWLYVSGVGMSGDEMPSVLAPGAVDERTSKIMVEAGNLQVDLDKARREIAKLKSRLSADKAPNQEDTD